MSLKSRRLFAILVIAAMVLMMLPATALADNITGANFSATLSKLSADKEEVEAGTPVKLTIELKTSGGTDYQASSPESFYIVASKDVITTWGAISGTNWTKAKENTYAVEVKATDSAVPKIELNPVSDIATEVTFKAYASGTFPDGPYSRLIGEVTVKWKVGVADKTRSTFLINGTTAAITVDAGYFITLSGVARDSGNNPVPNATIYIGQQDGSVYREIAALTSGSNGAYSTQLRVTKAGTTTYAAFVTKPLDNNNKIIDIGVTVNPGAAVSAAGEKTQQAIATTESFENITFTLKDAFGNNGATGQGRLSWDLSTLTGVTVKYTDGNSEETINALKGSALVSSGTTVTVDKNAAEYPVGTWKFTWEFEPANSKVEAELKAVKLGTIKALELKAERPLKVEGTTTINAILVDVDGIKAAAPAQTVTLATSDPSIATVDGMVVTGKKAGTVTITGIHKDGVMGTITLVVAGDVAGIKESVEVKDKIAEVTLQLVDKDGNPTYVHPQTTPTALTVIAPNVTVTDKNDFAPGTGKGSFKAEVKEYGTYTITVVGANVVRTFTVAFKAPKPPKPGAQNVVMFIGSKTAWADGVAVAMDVAPFIENGRTFVPVRFLANALGVDDENIDWEPKVGPVETVTLKRVDRTVVINIGEYVLTIIEDDEVSTITMDVAAFIRNGRTYLPFRFIAEAFGAEVGYEPKVGPVETVMFKQ